MAGILSSDPTCNTHNALRNISNYACGVTFIYKSNSETPIIPYEVVSLQECCDIVSAPVLRIPDNTGCEIQFCEVPSMDYDGVTQLNQNVTDCMRFVYKGDLPDPIAAQISDTQSWDVVRFYDDDYPPSEDVAAVTASAAPASWTSAVKYPWSGSTSTSTSTPTPTPTTSTSVSPPRSLKPSAETMKDNGGVMQWAIIALTLTTMMFGL